MQPPARGGRHRLAPPTTRSPLLFGVVVTAPSCSHQRWPPFLVTADCAYISPLCCSSARPPSHRVRTPQLPRGFGLVFLVFLVFGVWWFGVSNPAVVTPGFFLRFWCFGVLKFGGLVFCCFWVWCLVFWCFSVLVFWCFGVWCLVFGGLGFKKKQLPLGSKPPNHQTTKPPKPQTTKTPNHQTTKTPNHHTRRMSQGRPASRRGIVASREVPA